jgi:predicted RNA-binding Zn-ribbon protein involved in translation (DUF1610 family)
MAEPGENKYTYRWYRYTLNINCVRCNAPIPFQNVAASVVCPECGEKHNTTWEDLLEESDVLELKRGETGTRNIFSKINKSIRSAAAKEIICHHCQKPLDLTQNVIASASVSCNHCNEPLNFTPLQCDPQMIVYTEAKSPELPKGHLIAVRCVSCGAPLQTDPAQTHFTCTFCETENILPPTLRQKKVVRDVYIGVMSDDYALQLLSTMSADEALLSLKANTLVLSQKVIDKLFKRFPNSLDIYNHVIQTKKVPLTSNHHQSLWHGSEIIELISRAGKSLKKSKLEIDKQIKNHHPNYTSKALEAESAAQAAAQAAEAARVANQVAAEKRAKRMILFLVLSFGVLFISVIVFLFMSHRGK